MISWKYHFQREGGSDKHVRQDRQLFQVCNQGFIHSPAEIKSELYDQALAVSENQIEIIRGGIVDKTVMCEAGILA